MNETVTLPQLSMASGHAVPFDRAQLEPRILHIGPGAFFRAHQADYIDRLNAIDPKWGIVGLSLRSNTLQSALAGQDFLYTLVILGPQTGARVIASLLDVRTAHDADAMDAFLSPELKLITLTITEKGYCLTTDGTLDRSHPDIVHDLANSETSKSAIGWIVKGLKRRRASQFPAPIILSCDNLPGNGQKLQAAVLEFAGAVDVRLRDWICETAAFPCSMVDSITPATDDALRRRVASLQGYKDAWPVQREVFTDWIIETVSDARMPAFDKVGATFTSNVHDFEQAKLRLLNGAHSTLAYFGLAHGYTTVSEAMADGDMTEFIRDLMHEEIAPTLNAPAGLDLASYQNDLIARFQNPAIVHKLSQIAWDGSQKLPIRLLDTISDTLAVGRSFRKLAIGVVAWWRFIIRMTRAGLPITDPLANELSTIAARANDTSEHDCRLMLSLTEVFPEHLINAEACRIEFNRAYKTIMRTEEKAQGGTL